MLISAIVITRNEEKNIQRCLFSLGWVDEIILVDSFSEDKTIEIASQFPNVKIFQADWKGYSENKTLAVSKTKNDWVFWIDADEEVSSDLKNEILSLKKDTVGDAFNMPRKTFFLGEWIKHSGWYPARVTRLFRKTKCTFSQDPLHEKLVLNSNVRLIALKNDLFHYSYPTLNSFFGKMNIYGKLAAEKLMKEKVVFRWWKLVFHPPFTFFKFYFLQKGFLDGVPGFVVCVGGFFSNFIKWSNFYYLSKNKGES